ncbi:unnamed protein product (macronuclear) [Paramecium tetraurelia]|uniref:RING-CH-type domain-containing protein n=1 Tax=Paramecium tetraurelia TaxID=5888 RepID=A0E0P0_PARTE|nr:uncharacterized protein GSPATT00022025001 [Paramecium tetraurelia]CAK88857.1 unnamed protein product [Paramecium tetraurelia]|eukprot:XP_001456254.1 hypothetical protein (macronuclear) [Paramecium tetraurelia strain d4-2]
METETSPKILSFRINSNVNTLNSDLIRTNQSHLDQSISKINEQNKKIHQLGEGVFSENTDRNNQDSTNNTSCISNLSPLKPKQGQKEFENQFTFVSQEDSYNQSTIQKQSKQGKNSRLSISNKINTRKQSSSSIKEQIQEEKYCGICGQADQFSNFIRPCLCRSKQHNHQQCEQKDFCEKYIDNQSNKITKPLQCENCHFNFVIKSYKDINFTKAFKDPLKHRKVLMYLSINLSILILVTTLITLSILNRMQFRYHVEYIAGVIIACLILIGIKIVVTCNLIEYISNFTWYILDREQAKVNDNGVRMNQQTLNVALEHHQRKKQQLLQIMDQMISKKVHSELPIQNPEHIK